MNKLYYKENDINCDSVLKKNEDDGMITMLYMNNYSESRQKICTCVRWYIQPVERDTSRILISKARQTRDANTNL